jgi:DNA polymerase-3 subunit gamma/tau
MAYQSLYRRYRPRRFSEVRGQEHLVSALRNAVRDERVGHAYLLSGPRGTGKTSTARILAKVLNCENTIEGEPCCECASCLSIEAGTSFDVHELDAASNNGVESIRDLIAKASLGTPGRTKVYILDEVHMLSTAASNALLKTLEEPPEHVVFVLATTDPQKVLPTIRSRTQHFEVNLLSADDLRGLVEYVVGDAELELSPDGYAYVLRTGAGSARDTLSALDRVVAAGGVPDSVDAVDELVEALCDRDTGRALVAVDAALSRGRNPRVLGESLIARLRDVFLASMNADLSRLTEADRERVADQALRLTAPGATRALELLGEAFVGIQDALDPRIPLEVALVRLTRIDADTSLGALAERITRLENGAPRSASSSTGSSARPAAPAPAPAANVPAPVAEAKSDLDDDDPEYDPDSDSEASVEPQPSGGASRPADSARRVLRDRTKPTGAERPPPRPTTPGPSATRPSAPARPGPPKPAAPDASSPAPVPAADAPATTEAPETPTDATPIQATTPAPAVSTSTGVTPTLEQLAAAWTNTILVALPQRPRVRFAGGQWTQIDGDTAVFGLPNATHAQRCEECRSDVEAALAANFGLPVPVRLVVDTSAPDPSAQRGAAPRGRVAQAAAEPTQVDDEIHHSEVEDLPDANNIGSNGADRITALFPGAELLDGDAG